MSRGRSASRSASTGRFVSPSTARRSPSRATTERVGRGTSNSRAVNRSAATGRLVRASTAQRHPEPRSRRRSESPSVPKIRTVVAVALIDGESVRVQGGRAA